MKESEELRGQASHLWTAEGTVSFFQVVRQGSTFILSRVDVHFSQHC